MTSATPHTSIASDSAGNLYYVWINSANGMVLPYLAIQAVIGFTLGTLLGLIAGFVGGFADPLNRNVVRIFCAYDERWEHTRKMYVLHDEPLDRLKRDFATVRHAKPPASRKDSSEWYVVAPCCSVCGGGNTHTAPGEAEGTCAQWGAEHGAKD